MKKLVRASTLEEVHAEERAKFVPPGWIWFLCPKCGRGHIVQGKPVCPKEKRE